ncbi:DUF550 domain-containing protein [Salmonella enterica]|nr:DUF550 domain-containing protein [Salmonella enterica]EHP3176792.1 DUF550 domain-containing protein [Salmonella enterica subsp. enterica serovar Apapa]EKQ9731111.1 DUF550 domain-containing protein [Salmonella enterica subsp. enterica serovar Lattenkamp]EHO6034568.1 DUF550 domain-containing protein [Salmonella enterica]EHQ2721828.1 DUF550 domain-containing protein [Salmonella enterica]
MTALNKQALREELEICSKDRMRRIALALLDEWETDKEQIKAVESRNRRLDGIIDAAEHRLAELDKRLIEYAGIAEFKAMLHGSQPVSDRDELREQVRSEHAEWSDATFGDVGPVGPLKHLSKEALEAAADPSDPLEWADMQFLLWDAQRRMGISDEFITRAMIEKLEINKSRQWPEPKDGEPRLHIKEQLAPVVPPAIEPDYEVIKSILPTANPDEYACCIAADMWNACRAAMLQGAAVNSPAIPDGWVACSERMPETSGNYWGWWSESKRQGPVWFIKSELQAQFQSSEITHWMPLPAAPQQEAE